MGKNLAWSWVENFYVGVHTANTPFTQEWEAMISEINARKFSGSLIYTEGGAPSALQRKQLRDTIGQTPMNTAVLTNSSIARTAITALNLFMRNPVRAFPPNDLEAALQYVQAPPRLWPTMKQELYALKQQLGLL